MAYFLKFDYMQSGRQQQVSVALIIDTDTYSAKLLYTKRASNCIVFETYSEGGS